MDYAEGPTVVLRGGRFLMSEITLYSYLIGTALERQTRPLEATGRARQASDGLKRTTGEPRS